MGGTVSELRRHEIKKKPKEGGGTAAVGRAGGSPPRAGGGPGRGTRPRVVPTQLKSWRQTAVGESRGRTGELRAEELFPPEPESFSVAYANRSGEKSLTLIFFLVL